MYLESLLREGLAVNIPLGFEHRFDNITRFADCDNVRTGNLYAYGLDLPANRDLHRVVLSLDVQTSLFEGLDDGLTRMEPFHTLQQVNSAKEYGKIE